MAENFEQLARDDDEGAPDLQVLVDRIVERVLDQLHSVAPGLLSGVASSKQTGTAQPTVSRANASAHEAAVPDVPILQLYGAAGGLYIPPTANDGALLLYTNRSLDEWSQTDGTKIVRPSDPRAHDPTDALALIAKQMAAPTGAESAVGLYGDDVRLGAPAASEAAALGTTLAGALAQFALTCSVATLVSQIAAAAGTLYTALGGDVAGSGALSTKVKVA